MTLQQLEYVLALDEERHFLRAAERCNVTQPTLSMQVQKLEETLGVLLFDRKAVPIRPTPAGEQVIAHARQVLSEVQQIKLAAQSFSGWESGEYHLGIIPTLAPYLLPRFLTSFLEQHPGIRLVVEEMQTEAILEALKSHRLDLALIAGPVTDSEIQQTPVFYEPLHIYTAFDHPLAEAERIESKSLDSEGLWLLKAGHCLRIQTLKLCQLRGESDSRRFSFESGSIETLKTMVAQYGGFTLVPALSIAETHGDTGVYKSFAAPVPARAITVACHHSFGRMGLIRALSKAVGSSVPADFLSAEGKDIFGVV